MQKYRFDPTQYKSELTSIVSELLKLEPFSERKMDKILKLYPKDKNQIFSRDQIISGIELLKNTNEISNIDLEILVSNIKMKPMRTASGVTTVTVLTKPFACPGLCIFCPNDVRMPKSYIATEPGAQRALMNRFDPYTQVYNRLQALKNIGHPTDKIELLILGGTWSYYPKKYQIWFIHECFRAMNEFGSPLPLTPSPLHLESRDISEDLKTDINIELRNQIGDKPYNQLIVSKEYKILFKDKVVVERDVTWNELQEQQEINSHGKCRCVGLVLETRPDSIDEKEVLDMRKLGATKIQLGIQTLNDEISKLNKRGEGKADTAKAFALLRAGGFKIHGHIMPNLLGATPEIDKEVYKELFESLDYKPDELKIYPTSIIKNTELFKKYESGEYKPYSGEQLTNLIADCMEMTPEYCRLTRIIRDIPSTEIEGGNKTTNLREAVEFKLKAESRKNPNIRAREIGTKKVKFEDLSLDIIEYKTKETIEYFLQYITQDREIAGFLRLSIPILVSSSQVDIGSTLESSIGKDDTLEDTNILHGSNSLRNSSKAQPEYINPITSELNGCAIIREVHVYGPSLELSRDSSGEAQHLGLGTKLIEKAKQITAQNGLKKLAVISSIGTREYYEKRGFKLHKYYQVAKDIL